MAGFSERQVGLTPEREIVEAALAELRKCDLRDHRGIIGRKAGSWKKHRIGQVCIFGRCPEPCVAGDATGNQQSPRANLLGGREGPI